MEPVLRSYQTLPIAGTLVGGILLAAQATAAPIGQKRFATLIIPGIQAQTSSDVSQTTITAPKPDDEVRQAAEAVFERPEYWWKRTETLPKPKIETPGWLAKLWGYLRNIVVRVLKAILRFLAWLFQRKTGTGGTDYSAFLWALLAAVAGWLAWKFGPWLVDWLGNRQPVRTSPNTSIVFELSDPEKLYNEANQALADQRYAEAIRLGLLAQIAHLERLGWLRFDPTRTNREYERELRPRPELAAEFGRSAKIYERVWYGGQSPRAQDAEQVMALCSALILGREPPRA